MEGFGEAVSAGDGRDDGRDEVEVDEEEVDEENGR
jgi:hypothetical protein